MTKDIGFIFFSTFIATAKDLLLSKISYDLFKPASFFISHLNISCKLKGLTLHWKLTMIATYFSLLSLPPLILPLFFLTFP